MEWIPAPTPINEKRRAQATEKLVYLKKQLLEKLFMVGGQPLLLQKMVMC